MPRAPSMTSTVRLGSGRVIPADDGLGGNTFWDNPQIRVPCAGSPNGHNQMLSGVRKSTPAISMSG